MRSTIIHEQETLLGKAARAHNLTGWWAWPNGVGGLFAQAIVNGLIGLWRCSTAWCGQGWTNQSTIAIELEACTNTRAQAVDIIVNTYSLLRADTSPSPLSIS